MPSKLIEGYTERIGWGETMRLTFLAAGASQQDAQRAKEAFERVEVHNSEVLKLHFAMGKDQAAQMKEISE